MAITQRCKLTGENFVITDEEIKYCNEHDIPLPTISPQERLRRVTSFDNGIYLYNGKCAFSGECILTNFPPELGHTVYKADIFFSDQWDPFEYGYEYDFSLSFFDQFATLFKRIPLPSRHIVVSDLENCDYVNAATHAKNCYLIFNCTACEDCLFSRFLNGVKNAIDCIGVSNSELCYRCVNVQNGYNLTVAENCTNCQDSYFLFNCRNLKHCYGCSNLSGKEYYFENQACTAEEYNAKLQAKNLGSYKCWKEEVELYEARKKTTPRKYMQGTQADNCSGNYINQSQNCHDSFFVLESQDVQGSVRVVKAKDVYSSAFAVNNAEQIYSCNVAANNSYNLKWCLNSTSNTRDLEYCAYMSSNCHNCFGCVGLKQKAYCILNKQYSEETYFELLDKIKKQMKAQGEYGELFPASMSPRYYNESYAHEFAPLTRDEAIKRCYKWKDETVADDSPVAAIPDHIADVEDTILNMILTCEQSKKKYRLTKAELEFYRKRNVPVPRIAPLVRVENLSKILEMKPSIERNCDQCKIQLKTIYQEEKVLCESCYQNSFV